MATQLNEVKEFYPKNRKEWRQWLQKNHAREQAVWGIFYKKGSDMPSVSWSDAVDEALCFGWIDGRRRPIDEERFIQYFCKRRPGGTWSKINKDKIEQLIAAGQMTQAGLDVIEAAKQDGSWGILDSVEAMEMPQDLQVAFKKNAKAGKYYESLSRSVKKRVLQWLVMAKREETRQKRISVVIAHAVEGKLPKELGG